MIPIPSLFMFNTMLNVPDTVEIVQSTGSYVSANCTLYAFTYLGAEITDNRKSYW